MKCDTKMFVAICIAALCAACRELPPPDTIVDPDERRIVVTEPAADAGLDMGEDTFVRWISTEGLTGNVKIELLREGKPVLLLAESAAKNGELRWTIPELAVQGRYRIGLTIVDGVFTGESWQSDEFIIRKKWIDPGFVSSGAAWGASAVIAGDGLPVVMYQEENRCITVKKYVGTSWNDLKLEDNGTTYLSNYFSMNTDSDGRLLAVYTKDIDRRIVNRWDPEKSCWKTCAFLTAGEMAFGVSAAQDGTGNSVVAFATMALPAGSISDITDILQSVSVYLRARSGNGIAWEDDEPWKDESDSFWKDKGGEILPKSCVR